MQEPLIGVSVLEKGTTNGTITDLDGNFSLTVTSGSTVTFSYIGYLSQDIKAENVKGTIVLKEDAKALDEVVVIGYGTQKKVNLTGAVAAISGDEIVAKPASDVLSALQGRMPGVAVLRTSGEPGAETEGMRVRGFTSINETKVLVLIDGIEGDLTLVNPVDIESISVLKDAAAAAIYGARAAAGVVLVTTKTGTTGKPTITYNGYFAVNTPGEMPERLPAWEEQEFINISRINAGGTPEWNPEQSSWVGNPNFNYRQNPNGRWDLWQATNWVEEGTKDMTTQQSHAVTVTGGTKELNYLLSGNYYTKDGLLKYGPDSNERYNLRAKVNGELNKYLTFAINLAYDGKFIETNPNGSKWLLERMYRVRGRQPIYKPEEDPFYDESPYNGDLQVNPIDMMKHGGIDKNRYEAYTGKATLTIRDLVKGLRINLSASRKAGYYSQQIERRFLIWKNWKGAKRFSVNEPNQLTKKKNSDYQDLFEGTAHYDFALGKHGFNLMAGMTYENYRKDEIQGTVKNLVSNDLFSFNYYDPSVAANTGVGDLVEPWKMMSYFGRINYNYNDRYLLEANVRYDGSSRLVPGKQWKAFPSFSAAWRINEESWFNVPFVSNLKARASWGQLGNGAVLGYYDYQPLIDNGTVIADAYYYQNYMASLEKTWETIETTNIGVDMGFFNNRLNITADYYWKTNKDMLIPVSLPYQVGIKVPKANVGNLDVWGWEFEAGWKDKIGEVDYQVAFNMSDSWNKLTKMGNTNVINAGNVQLLEGYELNTIWGYKTDGYWNSRQEYLDYKAANPGYESFQDGKVAGGDVRYVAQGDGKHKISAGGGTPNDPGDLIYLGNSNGRYLYGFNLSLQWRNFDFSMFWQGVGKRNVLIQAGTLAPLSQTSLMPWTIHRDYARLDEEGVLINPDAQWPRLYNYNNQETFNFHASDKWIQDASYLRLKNVTVGYTLPIPKNIISKARVYVAGADVLEFTKLLSVFDPEVANNISANNYYPFFRTWTVGLNVTF